MKVSRSDLAGLRERLPPPPAPIEPRLSPEDEVAMIRGKRDDDGTRAARRQRALRLIRRIDTPKGQDAEILALLAAHKALPVETDEDRYDARRRLIAIANEPEPPPAVRRLLDDLGLSPGEGAAFAEKLFPERRDLSGGFDPPGSAYGV